MVVKNVLEPIQIPIRNHIVQLNHFQMPLQIQNTITPIFKCNVPSFSFFFKKIFPYFPLFYLSLLWQEFRPARDDLWWALCFSFTAQDLLDLPCSFWESYEIDMMAASFLCYKCLAELKGDKMMIKLLACVYAFKGMKQKCSEITIAIFPVLET